MLQHSCLQCCCVFPNRSTSKPLLHSICRSQLLCNCFFCKGSAPQLIVFALLQRPSRQFDLQGLCNDQAKACFTADCKYFSAVDKRWTGPYTSCSTYRTHLCLLFYPDWPCNGGAVITDALCDCDQYSRCFTNDACAFPGLRMVLAVHFLQQHHSPKGLQAMLS